MVTLRGTKPLLNDKSNGTPSRLSSSKETFSSISGRSKKKICYSLFKLRLYFLRLRCHRRTHATRSFNSTEKSYIAPINDWIEKREIQLVEWRHVNSGTMDLPKGSTSTKMRSPLPSMQLQRRPTLKWACHSTLLYVYTYIKIHSSPEQKKCITRQDCVKNEKLDRKARTRSVPEA